MEFPEVETVFGKAGRADTPTDPAPFSMVETTITLKPPGSWPAVDRFYSKWPKFLHGLFAWIVPPHRTYEELQAAMNERLSFAGIPNIWTMPIKNRIDMLATGIRTPLGIKILGADLAEIQKIAEHIEHTIKSIPGTRNAYAERAADGYYLDLVLDREALARYGIAIEEAQAVIASAVGGERISTLISGRERYSITVRYERAYREDISALKKILIPTSAGSQVPLELLAKAELVQGPAMIRNENGLLAGYVYIDIAGRDIGGFISEAKKTVAAKLKLPAGYVLQWSGQYENMKRVRERLTIVIPLTIFLIALLLYLNTSSLFKTCVVLLAVPFSLIGAVWLLYLLNYNLSIAVWVGMIALMGLDAETGVFMLLYLDLSYNDAKRVGKLRTVSELKEAIVHGAAKRIRPKMMTVAAAFTGLLPILFATGTGSDVMRRIAAPMIGGLITSFILELVVYPPLYLLYHQRKMPGVVTPPA